MVCANPESCGEHELFLGAIVTGDRPEAIRVLRRAAKKSFVRAIEEVVQPAMQGIGDLWAEGRLSIAEEHVATGIAESAVSALYPDFPWPVGGPKAVIACVPDERHAFAARLVADLFVLDGWDALFLGTSVPLEDIAALVRRHAPVFVGFSATLASHLEHVERVSDCLRRLPSPPKVLLGGRAARKLRDLPQGIDALALSAAEGVQLARAWRR